MAYEDYCAACTYLKEEVNSYGEYWCKRKGEYHKACDPKCYNFCKAYDRSDSARANMYDYSKSRSSGGGCYITTAMCEILGYEDNNYYLQTLRSFRDNFLKKDRKYWGLLITYDIIGPAIAENLRKETMKISLAMALFDNYINKAVTAIEHEKYEEAITIYTNMTNNLANRYGLDSQTIIVNANSTEIEDFESLGHARKKVLG
jgi:hypothetical protein